MHTKTFLLIFSMIYFPFLAFSQHSKYEVKAKALLSKMTLEEKLGQLNLPSSGDITTGQAKSSNIAQKIKEGKVGGLFNIKSAEKIREVQKIAIEESRLKIPLLFAMDVIHGYKTTFPIPLGLSCSWDLEMIEKTARTAANEATADGICWTFSPMVDISRDPRWGRIAEGVGEDAFLGSKISAAMVKGYQGNDLSADNTMMACVKHFALYGAIEAGRDYNTVDMSKVRMYNEYLPPYKAAIDAGVGSVMAAFNDINGVPATGNKWLLTDVLRNQWGFKGFVVTDYTAIMEMVYHGVGNKEECAAQSLNAGVDMDMVDEYFPNELPKALKDGKVTMEEIDQAVLRILIAKYKLGLFDKPYQYCDVNRAKTEVYTDENRAFARKVGAESMVLLKNEKHLLPLKKEGTIALIGPLSNTAVNMAGTWSVATDQDKSISVLEGFQKALKGKAKLVQAQGSRIDYNQELVDKYTIFGKKISDSGKSDAQLLQEALEVAKKADVIVATLGETAEMSGESSSRTNIEIPQSQKELLDALVKTGKPVVLVVFTGRPLVLTEENAKVSTILNAWFAGSEAGDALADVVFGEVNPSGKLTTTFPRSLGQVPIYYNHKNTGRPLSEEKTERCEFEKFKTGYLDECNTPLFPFGYGLSYTDFQYSNLQLNRTKLSRGGQIQVSVEVKNTGNYDGKEVVQLYIRDLVGSITRPVKELKGFQKIFLPKGESQKVVFTLTEEDLKFYNGNLDFVAEPGSFEVFVGGDSSTKMKKEFELE